MGKRIFVLQNIILKAHHLLGLPILLLPANNTAANYANR
jgi:hypothetical protein